MARPGEASAKPMQISAWLSIRRQDVRSLNRAAAVAFADGPAAALPLLDELGADPRLADYPYLPATRAELLRRLGDAAGAAQSYRRALELTANAAERAFLEQRLAEVSQAAGADPAPD